MLFNVTAQQEEKQEAFKDRDVFIEDRHKAEYGEAPQVVSTVPGVTTFVGEFSVYCQGFALCGTNDKSLFVAVSQRADSSVRVFNGVSNDRKKFNLTGIKFRKEDRWGNYVKGIILELQQYIDIPGVNISLGGTLLQCDGKVLSAAVGIGVGMALSNLVGKEIKPDILASCVLQSSLKFCKELFNLHLILTMLHSKEGSYMLFDMRTCTYKYLSDPFKNSPFSLVLVNGNIPPLAMREELYTRHTFAKETMENLSLMYPNVNFREFPIDDLLDRLLPVEEETRTVGCYVFEESETAQLLEKFFTQKDFVQIGKSFSKIGIGLRDKLELTCPELDWLSKRSLETIGCIGSTLVYNGCGGYIAMVMKNSSFEQYVSKLDEYERIFGFKATAFVYTPQGSASSRSVTFA